MKLPIKINSGLIQFFTEETVMQDSPYWPLSSCLGKQNPYENAWGLPEIQFLQIPLRKLSKQSATLHFMRECYWQTVFGQLLWGWKKYYSILVMLTALLDANDIHSCSHLQSTSKKISHAQKRRLTDFFVLHSPAACWPNFHSFWGKKRESSTRRYWENRLKIE